VASTARTVSRGQVIGTRISEFLLQLIQLGVQFAVVAFLDRREHIAVDPVAIDVMSGDELFDERGGPSTETSQNRRVLRPLR